MDDRVVRAYPADLARDLAGHGRVRLVTREADMGDPYGAVRGTVTALGETTGHRDLPPFLQLWLVTVDGRPPQSADRRRTWREWWAPKLAAIPVPDG